jgi:branched-chain amino acid transport system permease protein
VRHLAGHRTARKLALLALVIALIVVVANASSAAKANEFALWACYGLLTLSLSYVWGRAGIMSLGQGLMFGVGAYAYGIAAINLLPHTGETVSAVIIAVGAGALAAALLGAFLFYGRMSGIYVAVVTLAAALVVQTLINSTGDPKYHVGTAEIGGYDGMPGIPTLGFAPGSQPTPLNQGQFLMVVSVIGALTVAALLWLDRRPFGRVIAALRDNEERTQLLGYDTRRYKLGAFVIGGAVAALAGACFAAWGQIVSPDVFGLNQAALIAVWALVGGMRSLPGAFVGTFLVELATNGVGGDSANATPFLLGGGLVLCVLLLPQGVVPTLRSWIGRLGIGLQGSPETPVTPSISALAPLRQPRANGALSSLEVRELSKRFGGVTAVDSVSLRFGERGIWCVIGPNGAGKSTFFGLLVGRYRPDAGQVQLGGVGLEREALHLRARRGFGIKLQVASIYPSLSVLENLWLASYAASHTIGDADQQARAIVAWLGLADEAMRPAGVLSHGHQQWLEIGMVLAGRPSVMLLDEPTAGMTRAETERTADLISALAEDACVIVVEHDMEFVRRLDAPVIVFHEGSVFAQGLIEQLRNDERILQIYLGKAIAHA